MRDKSLKLMMGLGLAAAIALPAFAGERSVELAALERANGAGTTTSVETLLDQINAANKDQRVTFFRGGKEHYAGDECPAQSGKYCGDAYPTCCYVNSKWQCFKSLSDCTE